MNLLNYSSLEASKRLVEAGVVLETDISWYKNIRWFLRQSTDENDFIYPERVPAPLNGRGVEGVAAWNILHQPTSRGGYGLG